MLHFILFIYITAIAASSISIFSTALVYYRSRFDWILLYLFLLSSFTCILICYSLFYYYFIFRGADFNKEIIVFFISAFTGTFICLALNMVLKIVNTNNTGGTSGIHLSEKHSFLKLLKTPHKIIGIFFKLPLLNITFPLITASVLLLWNYSLIADNRVLSLTGSILLSAILLSIFIPVIKNYKTTAADEYKRVFIYLIFALIPIFPLVLIEQFLLKFIINRTVSIPSGLISLALGLLSFNIFNTIFTLKFLFNENKKENKILTNELSDSFIKKYSITKREGEVIKYLIMGHSNREIGSILYIAVRTVDRHVYNIYGKCGIKTRIDLINIVNRL